jgi:hypothetical protein
LRWPTRLIPAIAAVLVIAGTTASAAAQTPGPVEQTLRFFAGAATGLVAHETGHVMFGVAFDAHPNVIGIDYGPLPFFAIHHDPVSPREEFVISSAGFWIQHAGSEWILTAKPHLKDQRSPFLKGMLAFNLATSAVYSVAAFGGFGPPERDTRSMASSLGKDGVPEPVIGLLVLAPAALDGYRYLHPEQRWAVWASRSVKVALVVLTVAAGR